MDTPRESQKQAPIDGGAAGPNTCRPTQAPPATITLPDGSELREIGPGVWAAEGEPPLYNMGDTNELNPQDNTEINDTKSFRFDWYQATLPRELEPLRVLGWARCFGEPKPCKAMHGYDVAFDCGSQVKILYGGHSGQYGVHVIIHGGDACQEAVESFRAAFPVHRPSRVDVCLDALGDDAWKEMSGLGRKAALKHKIQTMVYGDWLEKKRGRTLYIGGRKSIYRARIYEKGHEMRIKGKMPDAPLDWVRLEFQIRPPRHNREVVATMTPDQLARSGRWARHICAGLETMTAEVVRLNTRRPTPAPVESISAMLGQYARVVAKVRDENWMTKDQFAAICGEWWDSGEFRGLPKEVIREWYF